MAFSDYWFPTSPVARLNTLVRSNSQKCLQLQLNNYLSDTFSRSELNRLNTVSFLFYSGYLTPDQINFIKSASNLTDEMMSDTSYSFRFPNYEVSSAYYQNCLEVISDLNIGQDFLNRGEALQRAILASDLRAVNKIPNDYNFFPALR
jgi:hypothetical protein